jgi:hypothetical protein
LAVSTVIALATVCRPVAAQSPPVPAPESPPVRRALLIGINQYRSGSVPPLRGSVNDVEAMVQVLTSRYGFLPKDIRVLEDASATREAILGSLTRLASESGARDVVFIHYAGHGSQVKHVNGEEAHGIDGTIVSYDGRTAGVADITLDELARTLAQLRSAYAVLVLDASHSGTPSRGMDVRTRSIPPDPRLDLYQAASSSSRPVVHLAERNVVIAGAASDEEAVEGIIDGACRGAFSYALTRTLASARPGVSAREVLSGVARELARIKPQFGRNEMPGPQLQLPREHLDAPFLGGSESESAPQSGPAARLAWTEVRPVGERQVLLVNGVAMGAAAGSAWGIYPPGEMEFAPGTAVAVARVATAQVSDRDVLADLQAGGRPAAAGSRAVELSPPMPGPRIPVRILAAAPERSAALATALRQALPTVDAVGQKGFARFVIELKDTQCLVFGTGGLEEIGRFDASNTATLVGELSRLFSRSARSAELLALDNPSSAIQLEVRVPSPSPPPERHLGGRGVQVQANTRLPEYRVRREGDPRLPKNSLQLEIRASTAVYLTIADVDAVGKVNLLFPNPVQNDEFYPLGLIPGGETVRIPDSLAPGNRAAFNWDLSPPAGADTIRVFASKSRETAQLIRDLIEQAGASSGSRPAETPTASLRALQEKLAETAATRAFVHGPASAAQTPAPGGDWAATSVTITVKE